MINKIIEGIIAYAKAKGIPVDNFNEVILFFIILGICITLLKYLWKFINWFFLWKNQRKLNRNLNPYFSQNDVQKATRNYIKTKYQNVAPSEDEEPGKSYIASAKGKLIPLFLKEVFKKNQDSNKYYLLLADTGMGKTTFMINLFLKYKNQIKWPWTFKSKIKLFPLGAPNILDKIEKLENKNNTILLLDAFDEDVLASEDYKKRISTIIYKTQAFKEIVITCRTQFFPSKEEVPNETGYMTYGDSRNLVKFQKLYISVFNEKDINRYLKKKYNFLNPFKIKKFFKAKKLVKKSPNLMMRPMLLAHIDDLIYNSNNYKFTYQIYETLIDKWIDREASKPSIRQNYKNREEFKKLLYDFSIMLAVNLYDSRGKREAYCITKEEIEEKGYFIKSENSKSLLSDIEMKSKSLLNRNAKGEYKFSHKSILEYFLAVYARDDVSFKERFKFIGMDAARKFYKEKCFNEYLFPKLTKINGKFSTDGSKMRSLSSLTIDNFHNVKVLIVREFNDINLSLLNCFEDLFYIQVSDIEKYPALYYLYYLIYENNNGLLNFQNMYKELKKHKTINKKIKRGYYNKIQFLRRERSLWFQELITQNLNELGEHLIGNATHLFNKDNLFFHDNPMIIQHTIQKQIRQTYSEKVSNNFKSLEELLYDHNIYSDIGELQTELKLANKYISNMNELKKGFGEIEFIY